MKCVAVLDALEMEAISDPATEMLNELMAAIPEIIGAAIILAVFFLAGNFFANLSHKLLSRSEGGAFIASLARYAILALVLAIGLSLGAIAVAVALSFGLGGREAAGKHMEHILSKFRKDGQ